MRGRWPRRSTARSAKQLATRWGRAPASSARRLRRVSPKRAGCGSRSGVSRVRHSMTHAPCPSRSRCSRILTNGWTMSKLSTPTPPLPQPLQMLADPDERMDDVEVVHAHQLAAPRVEEAELAECEELQRAAEAGPRAPRRLGDPAHPAVVARVEVHQPVALAERPAPDDNALRLVQRHR